MAKGNLKTMIITTTPSIEGVRITKYLGVITGEAILGANIFRDMFAAVRDIVGGRSASYERELGKAREIALAELEDWAEELGANAIVGVNLDYESFGQSSGMMMVSATGTAVFVERNIERTQPD
jgi:uncharacterized protein YbjQ (UPF0145 family)